MTLMTLKKRCFTCRRNKLWFRIKKRSFLFPVVSKLPIVSNDEMCFSCFEQLKEVIFKGAPPIASSDTGEINYVNSENPEDSGKLSVTFNEINGQTTEEGIGQPRIEG